MLFRSDAFYRGAIAQQVVAASRAGGGYLALDDFAQYKPRVLDPLKAEYHGHTVCTAPPPMSGGATLLATLGMLRDVDWQAAGADGAAVRPRDARYIDQVARALQQIYPEVARTAADVPGSIDMVAKLLEPANLKRLAKRAGDSDSRKPDTAPSSERAGARGIRPGEVTLDDAASASTTHLIIVDRAGNVACATLSLGNHFGAAVVAPGTGFLLNNDMNNFAYATPGSANDVAGGKWPRSTMTPTIVLKDGRPVLAIGAPGGQRIPTGVLQVTLDVLDFNRPLRDAIDAPRFHLRRPSGRNEPPNQIDLEAATDGEVEKRLENLGWATFQRENAEFYFGAINAAVFLPGGKMIGVADQRRTGDAVGD